MINIYPYQTLGHADHGWLNARHHFSFANYYNPSRTGFGSLIVVNDDTIQSGMGFGTHPHKDMEIITYVRKGAITHKDNQGNIGRTEAGNVQVMSAGTGIFHSEFNQEDEDTVIYQMWILPNKTGVKPRWDQREFPTAPVENNLTLLVSGDQNAPLNIYADAEIYAGRLNAGTTITHPVKRQAYILASKGEITVNGETMKKGDGAEVTNLTETSIHAVSDSEVLVLDVPLAPKH